MLGRWIAQTKGAKFWLTVVTKLKNRGLQDVFIACVDGLKGFPEAIEAVYPKAIFGITKHLNPFGKVRLVVMMRDVFSYK